MGCVLTVGPTLVEQVRVEGFVPMDIAKKDFE